MKQGFEDWFNKVCSKPATHSEAMKMQEFISIFGNAGFSPSMALSNACAVMRGDEVDVEPLVAWESKLIAGQKAKKK